MRQLKITNKITLRDEDSISRYFQEISRYPLVSVDEEAELSVRIKKGDNAAMEKLVLANLRFVISVAKQYQNQGMSFNDLINEGNLGLVKAAAKFDETRGFKFISYAVWWIRQSILQAIANYTRTVRLPLNRITSINKINKAIPDLEQQLERFPSDNEIAGYLDVNCDEIKFANQIKHQQISLDKPASNSEESDFTLYERIASGNTPPPDMELMRESGFINMARILKKLSKRDSDILIMSFGLFGSHACSLHEIGTKYNLSSERIRQIKTEAIHKLQTLFNGNQSYLHS